MKLHSTSGVILDPFSIHATGIMRKHYGIKTVAPAGTPGLFDSLHGEARFKQAFTNACHFAESMTVFGPVAQMTWDMTESNPHYPAIFWDMKDEGNNEKIFNQFKQYMDAATWKKIPKEAWTRNKEGRNLLRLNLFPDFSLTRDDILTSDHLSNYDAERRLTWHLFQDTVGASTFIRATQKASTTLGNSVIHRGFPTLALLGVMFTFKKPTGSLAAYELTNLASWPPVVFLLPVLVPAGTTVSDNKVGNTVRRELFYSNPMMSTYRVALDTNTNIMPYGQPFNLSSVSKKGKVPDTLRSLSDVFKALWSQATQYCALRADWDVDHKNPPSGLGSEDRIFPANFSLDPIGAGRRIRGHNRYSTSYPMRDLQFLWELEASSETNRLFGWNLTGSDVRPFNRQLRCTHTGNRETIFVMPSYFTEKTTRNLYPVALAMMRFFSRSDAGLSTFLSGNIVGDVQPAYEDDTAPHTAVSESFLDKTVRLMFGSDADTRNRGALPLHRVEGEIEFDPSGDPTVFGTKTSPVATKLLKEEADLTDEQLEEAIKETKMLGDFNFIDAICSSNTKDLTEVFKEISAKGLNTPGSKAASLLDDALRIDLFGDDDDGDGIMF
jgi:hypothetical protein